MMVKKAHPIPRVSLMLLTGCLLLVVGRSLAQTCTLCIDGSDPPLLNAPVFDYDNPNATCSDFVDAANALPEDSLACRQLQDVGLSNCGCTTPGQFHTRSFTPVRMTYERPS